MTHPLRVDWLPRQDLPGRVGLTLAPGKVGPSIRGDDWARDLESDLERLWNVHGVGVLVCLLEPHELVTLRIPEYERSVAALGFSLLKLPIPDCDVPSDPAAVHQLLADIRLAAKEGKNVVIHCRGGVGRAGTIAGCHLVACGMTPDEALAVLAAVRDPDCPELEEQREYVRRFVPA